MNDLFKKDTDLITEEDIKNTVCSFVEKIEPCTSDEELVKKLWNFRTIQAAVIQINCAKINLPCDISMVIAALLLLLRIVLTRSLEDASHFSHSYFNVFSQIVCVQLLCSAQ